MATLVLTAAGTALGGPIGGALGAILGQQLDQNILFKPKGREGPRLQELAVQTSSYGSQIPRIYGKMRVAGTVIWATDLKETRNSEGGGKGRPSTTTYSYSASFAVALSSRNVKDIGRIWADGKIFRGRAGDFKTPSGYRFYPGGENQPVDSLIAASEASGMAPAHRGLAVALFEDMDLTDYGNRIPSLTFEVIADDGNIGVADLINDVSNHAIVADHDQVLHGFAASGADRRDALELVADSFPLSFGAGPAGIIARSRSYDDTQSILAIGRNDLARNDGEGPDDPDFQTLPETRIARQLSLRYYDPDRDYQSGLQNAFRSGESRATIHQDFPAAIDAATAKRIAQNKLWSLYQERSTARADILQSENPAFPGSLIKLDEGPEIWRVRGWEYKNGVVELSLSNSAVPWTETGDTEEGRSVQQLDALAGQTRLELIDLPFAIDAPLQASSELQLYALAAGEAGWRNAQLYSVKDGETVGELIGQITAPGIIGTGTSTLPPASPFVIDQRNRLEVELHNTQMNLNNADEEQLLAGWNIAAYGREIIQFGHALPLGNGRFELSHLIRGLGGTENEIDQHVAGEVFLLLDASATRIDPRYFSTFQPVNIAALGRGDEELVISHLASTGRALRPWSPVHPQIGYNGNGDMEVAWTRRSPAGQIWLDNIEVPVAEESEAYRVTVSPYPEGVSTTIDTGSSSHIIAQAELQNYQNQGATALSITIHQIGQYSLSVPLIIYVLL